MKVMELDSCVEDLGCKLKLSEEEKSLVDIGAELGWELGSQ